MKANFKYIDPKYCTQEQLDKRAGQLSKTKWNELGSFREESELPEGFEGYHCVDVVGTEFAWMNETFPKEKFTWYLWFESVFLVPEEMVPFLKLRWT